MRLGHTFLAKLHTCAHQLCCNPALMQTAAPQLQPKCHFFECLFVHMQQQYTTPVQHHTRQQQTLLMYIVRCTHLSVPQPAC